MGDAISCVRGKKIRGGSLRCLNAKKKGKRRKSLTSIGCCQPLREKGGGGRGVKALRAGKGGRKMSKKRKKMWIMRKGTKKPSNILPQKTLPSL